MQSVGFTQSFARTSVPTSHSTPQGTLMSRSQNTFSRQESVLKPNFTNLYQQASLEADRIMAQPTFGNKFQNFMALPLGMKIFIGLLMIASIFGIGDVLTPDKPSSSTSSEPPALVQSYDAGGTAALNGDQSFTSQVGGTGLSLEGLQTYFYAPTGNNLYYERPDDNTIIFHTQFGDTLWSYATAARDLFGNPNADINRIIANIQANNPQALGDGLDPGDSVTVKRGDLP